MFRRFIQDDAGLELTEYAAAAALITLVVVGAFVSLGDAITEQIRALADMISG